ncbi:MAG: hydrogenase formation protein HypD [Actinobacteria bacterium]|nr:hydrogenase formation protein HypD [Actinomycetota bacterium]
MKLVSEFRDPNLAKYLIDRLKATSSRAISLMEVCGTHTVAISRNGMRQVIPETIKLLSGPGCPVCVTANSDIDYAIELAKTDGVTMTTFGDMMKVPGSYSSFTKEKAAGADIRVVYSTIDALKIAEENPDREIVFFGVGFETTSPTVALSVVEAKKRGLKNYSVYARHKVVPPAMAALLSLGEVKIDGFICPGHVSAVIGSAPYEFIAEDYGIPCVIVGFEPIDILQGILMLVEQVESGRSEVEIQYKRTVRPEGNPAAVKLLNEVFKVTDADWRGIGVIPATGMALKPEFAGFDAEKRFSVELPPTREPKGCACGEILRGVKLPYECKIFGKSCTPEHPVGPCMVSTEGACAAYYRYDRTSVKVG